MMELEYPYDDTSMQLAIFDRATVADDHQAAGRPAGGVLCRRRLHVRVRDASPLWSVAASSSRPLHQSPQGLLQEVSSAAAAVALSGASRVGAAAVAAVVSGNAAAVDVARQDEHVADAAAEGGHLGAERAEAERAQRLDELREEVGAVVAADGGLEHGAARREHHDLVVLRREQVRRRRLADAGHPLLQVTHPLHRLRQQRRLVYLDTQPRQARTKPNPFSKMNLLLATIKIDQSTNPS